MKLAVTVYKNPDETARVKANASVIIDDAIVIKEIKIIEGANGAFVSMPSRRREVDGQTTYVDIVHPINAEAREQLNNAILEEYNKLLK